MNQKNNEQLKWYEKPLRISAVQCNYGEDSFDILENHVYQGRFNTEQLLHLNAEGHTSFYNHERDAEKLKAYIEQAKKRNIRIILYWNTHCVEKPARDVYPSWIQRDKNKQEVKAYTNKYLICVNSPWADDFMENLVKVCALDIDGIFIDGPVVNAQGCHCEACQKRFRQQYDKSIFDAHYHEMLAFKVDSVTAYVKKTYEIKTSVNSDIIIYLNNSSLRADVTGSNTTKVEPYVDMLGTEAGFAYISKSYDLCHMTPHIKYIETKAQGKPYVVFIAGDNKPHSYYLHTAAETKILYYRSVAHGANIWYGIHAPTSYMKSPGGQAAYECNRFLEKHETLYQKTVSLNKIAIVWSADTANYYSSSVAESDFTQAQSIGAGLDRGNHSASFYGFCQVLQRYHMQFDVIDEQTILQEDLKRYELVIFPVCACMSDAMLARVRTYVKNGGHILATYDTGCCDEYGRRQNEDRIIPLFGIDKMNGTVTYEAGMSFAKVRPAYSKGMNAETIPGPLKVIDCTPGDAAELVAAINRPMESRYVAFPKMELPLVLKNNYGEGSCLYCSGNFGEYIQNFTYSDNMLFFKNIIETLANPITRSNAPQSVEWIVRYQPNGARYILHAVNMTGEMTRPIERVMPLFDIELQLDLDIDIASVEAIDATCQAMFDPVSRTITIDRLDDYALMVLNIR